MRLSLGKLLVNLLQVVKRTDIPLIYLSNISVVGTSINIRSIEYPKSAKSTAIENAPEEVLRVKCEFIIFPGNVCLYLETNGHCVR